MPIKAKLVIRILENMALIFSWFLLIPPVPSDPDTRYGFFPLGVMAVLLFGLSRYLCIRRGGENWIPGALQLMFFLGFALVVHIRIGIR